MDIPFKAALLLTAVCANSVMAAPVMPEGQAGVTQEITIGRSLAQNSQILRVGDDRFLHQDDLPQLYPTPLSPEAPVIQRWTGDDDYPVKHPPRLIVVPRYIENPPLPASCAREYFTFDLGWANYYGARCLEKSYRDAAYLPQACALTIHTEGRWRDVYDQYCLAQAGYTESDW